jgi:hypothetical protein
MKHSQEKDTSKARLPLEIEPQFKASVDSKVVDWLSQQEPAISGQCGHDRTFYVACCLVQGFDLSAEEAYPFLAEWNRFCEPPWSEAELWHKLNDAEDAESDRPRGYMLRKYYKKNELPLMDADLKRIRWSEAVYLPVFRIDPKKAVYLPTYDVKEMLEKKKKYNEEEL